MNAAPERLDFLVLGPVAVRSGRGPLDLGSQRQRAVLALLALSANRVVPRDTLVDAVWGERAPKTAHNALQVAVHGLRKSLGRERVQTQGAGYRLVADREELDLARFEELLDRARGEPADEAAATLREALRLHRGAALADLGELPFVTSERARIEELRLGALERRVEADLDAGRAGELVPELESLVAAHPYRERFRAQLMLALYRSGRQADALARYREARTTLVDELGVEPSPDLQELHAAILRQDASVAAPERGDRPPTSLPVPARPLIGRELERAALTAHLRAPDARLVTITGPGGTGKTRLALEVAWSLVDEFPGGVHFVDLAPLRVAALVAPTAARALGVRDAAEGTLVARISSAVGERDTLVVLDNFEHVLDAAPFVAELLARTSRVRVLATSREPLRVAAEHEYRAPPLELPPAGAASLDAVARTEAVALFVARARVAEPRFALSDENLGAVVGICRALDGLPLALELAATRVRILSPAALLERLSDRLAVLADGERDLPDRQRTLRATIEWSYELLEPPERVLLARLSVFAGGWTLDAAEAVCDASLSTLGSLVEKSLVQSHPGADEPRFSMLETVREYALERLSRSGEEAGLRERHAMYFAGLAERLEPELYSTTAFDEAEREYDNVRVALAHAYAGGETELLLRLTAFARFWYVRGFLREGREWLARALERESRDARRRAVAVGWAAGLDWTLGDFDGSIASASESLELCRQAGDELGTLRALTILGLAHTSLGDYATSRRFHTESLELARELGRDRDVALALANLSGIAFHRGDHDEARALCTESLEIARRIDDRHQIGTAHLALAASSLEVGDAATARALLLESMRYLHEVGWPDYLASALVALARANEDADPTLAARLLGAARAIRAPLGEPAWQWEQAWFERALERVQGLLGDDDTAAALEAGARDPGALVAEILERRS